MRIYLFLSVFFAYESLQACSCAYVPLSQKYADSDYVYLGKVVHSKMLDSGKILSKLIPIEYLKGSVNDFSLMSESGDFDACKRFVFTGFEYIVFGKYGEIPFYSFCTYTIQYDPRKNRELNILKNLSINNQ